MHRTPRTPPRDRALVALACLALLLLAGCDRGGTEPEPVDDGPGTRVVARTGLVPLYPDGRPNAMFVLPARDHGVVLRHGDGPDSSDVYGARDVWVYEDRGTYYMHYDAAGPRGWLAALATSTDLVSWKKHGPVLDLGAPGEPDSRSASYGVTYREGDVWHMFYLGTAFASPAPDHVPEGPYMTLKARAASPAGPWTKQKDRIPFWPTRGTYYEATASPGHVIRYGGEYLQFFSATDYPNRKARRTIGIARTRDLDGRWAVDPEPIVPNTEQIENASLYYEEANGTWFLFTNHVAVTQGGGEYTDAIWAYWTRDLNRWDPANKALVLEGRNSNWSRRIIGLPSVIRVGDRLAVFYDGLQGSSLPSGIAAYMKRDVGLAWLDLPLVPPP